jgi:hypothetical protein
MNIIAFLAATAPSPAQVEVGSFLAFAVPFIILVYLGFLLFIHPSKAVLGVSLLSGLVVGIINVIFDLLAYYAHWWHYYSLSNLVLHLPLPFYITPVLIYGSLAYLLIWRFWQGRGHWFAMLLLIGVPIFCVARDAFGALSRTSYISWDNVPLAALFTIIMWLLAFYIGYFLFRRYAPARGEYLEQQAEHA